MRQVIMLVLTLFFFPGLSAQEEDPAVQRALLKSRQTEAMYRFQTLLETLDAAAENIKSSDPKASARLLEAGRRLKQHQLMGRMDEILSCLSAPGKKFTAEKVSEAVAADLKRALELLTLDESELTARAIESLDKALEELIAAQKALDASGLKGADKERKQQELVEKADKAAQEMKAMAAELGEAGEKAQSLVEAAASEMKQNASAKDSEHGKEAQKKLQEAREALKNAGNPTDSKEDPLEALRREITRLIAVQDEILGTLEASKGRTGRAALKKIEGLKTTYAEQVAALQKLEEAFTAEARAPLAEETGDILKLELLATGKLPVTVAALPPTQVARNGLEDLLEALKDLEPVTGDGGGGGGGGGSPPPDGPVVPDITQAVLLLRQQKRVLSHTEAERAKEALAQQEKAIARLQAWEGALSLEEAANPSGKWAPLLKDLEALTSWMLKAQEGLAKPDTSEEVRQPQRVVIKYLEDLIERSRPKKQESPPTPGEPQSGPPSDGPPGPMPGDTRQVTDNKPAQGAQKSQFRQGSNREGELRKFVESEVLSAWGKLPQKEKDKMVQEMREKIPPAQARWIEEFSRRLAAGEAE